MEPAHVRILRSTFRRVLIRLFWALLMIALSALLHFAGVGCSSLSGTGMGEGWNVSVSIEKAG